MIVPAIINSCMFYFRFLGHEQLYKEVILNESSLVPVNYTHVFKYADKEHEFVTSAKFQVDNVSKTKDSFPNNATVYINDDDDGCYYQQNHF